MNLHLSDIHVVNSYRSSFVFLTRNKSPLVTMRAPRWGESNDYLIILRFSFLLFVPFTPIYRRYIAGSNHSIKCPRSARVFTEKSKLLIGRLRESAVRSDCILENTTYYQRAGFVHISRELSSAKSDLNCVLHSRIRSRKFTVV